MGLVQLLKRELSGRKLLFNVIWHGIHVVLFIYGWLGQKRNPKLQILNLLKYSVWASRGAGLCLAFDGAVMFLPRTYIHFNWVLDRFLKCYPAKLMRGTKYFYGVRLQEGDRVSEAKLQMAVANGRVR